MNKLSFKTSFINTHLLLALMFLFINGTISSATNYYISSSEGNDRHNGLSTKKPFKSLTSISKLHLDAGDTIFLKRGDVFYGSLAIKTSGEEGNKIVITAYGTGDLPRITGAKSLSHYDTDGNLLKAKVNHPVYTVFLDDKFVLPARYPSSQFLYFDGGGRNYMIDSTIEELDMDIVDATIRMRIKNWSYENKQIDRVRKDTVFFDRSLWYNNYEEYVCERGWGYFLDNKKEFIENELDWAFDNHTKTFFIKNTDRKKIEISAIKHGLVIDQGVGNITIKNIVFEKFYEAGILINKDANNIVIDNCVFRNIYLKGIESKENSNHIEITNCEVMDIFGQGISVLEGNNFLIEKNHVKRIGSQPGYGIDGNNGGMGIIITNNEKRPEGYTTISHDNLIRHNRVDSVGNYAIRMDGKNSLCEYNYVSNGLLTFNDGALIYSWGMDSTFSRNNIIQHNIATKTHGNLDGTPNSHLINIGIYIDNNVNNVIVQNNTVTETGIGILFNSLSFENQAHNNILFNNIAGICFTEYHKGQPIYGMEVKNNIIVGLDYDHRGIYSKSFVHSSLNPGIVDENFYYNPRVEFFINAITTYDTFRRDEEMSFSEWQKRGFDRNGKTISPNQLSGNKYLPEHFVNHEHSEKVVDLNGYQYFNLSEEPIECIRIPPFSSVIVLRKLL
jgi:hypothetical protein